MPESTRPERSRGATAAERRSHRGEPVQARAPRPGTILGMPRFMFALMVGMGGAAVLLLILQVVVGPPSHEVGGVLRYPDQGRRVLAEGETFAAYNSFPATSGPHAAEGGAAGIYGPAEPAPFDVVPQPEAFLPLLERGGVVIYYDPGALPPTDQERLRNLAVAVQAQAPNVALVPLDGLAARVQAEEGAPAPLVLAAWRHLLPLAALDEAGRNAMADFLAPARDDGYYDRFVLNTTPIGGTAAGEGMNN